MPQHLHPSTPLSDSFTSISPAISKLPWYSSYLSVVQRDSRCPFCLVHATTETHLLSRKFGPRQWNRFIFGFFLSPGQISISDSRYGKSQSNVMNTPEHAPNSSSWWLKFSISLSSRKDVSLGNYVDRLVRETTLRASPRLYHLSKGINLRTGSRTAAHTDR